MRSRSRARTRTTGGRRNAAVIGAVALLIGVAGLLPAQGRRNQERSNVGATDFSIHNVPYDARYIFVRARFTPSRTSYGRGGGYFGGVDYFWDHDYPTADRHFTTILRELTAIIPSSGTNVIALGSEEMFNYPIAYVSEPGYWTQTETEVTNLRNYMLKGGFLIFDDFAEGQALANFQRQLARVLPDARLVEIPASHPIFNSFFAIDPATQTSTYQIQPYFLGVFEDNDPSKRLMLVANYNNDIGDAWEWSDQGLLPIDLTNEAFKLGVNYLVYAMTH